MLSTLPASSAAYSSYLPRSEGLSTYYPPDFPSLSPEAPHFYGLSTGTRYPYHASEVQPQPHKRRRIDTGPSNSSTYCDPTHSTDCEHGDDSAMKGEHLRAQLSFHAGSSPAATEPPPGCHTSPKRTMDLSSLSALLCPCCGFGWSQPDGMLAHIHFSRIEGI